jgi:hypothetical protein
MYIINLDNSVLISLAKSKILERNYINFYCVILNHFNFVRFIVVAVDIKIPRDFLPVYDNY